MGQFKKWIVEGYDLLQSLSKEFPNLPVLLGGFNVGPLRFLDRGDKGSAFTDGKVVVKFTEDRSEALASANLIGNHIPGVVDVFYVGRFSREINYQDVGDEEPIPTQYYIIIQELSNTSSLSPDEKMVADLVGGYLSNNIDSSRRGSVDSLLKGFIEHVVEIGQRALIENNAELCRSLFDTFFALRSRGILFFDIGSRNIGKNRSGEPVLFDLGISKSPKVPIPAVG